MDFELFSSFVSRSGRGRRQMGKIAADKKVFAFLSTASIDPSSFINTKHNLVFVFISGFLYKIKVLSMTLVIIVAISIPFFILGYKLMYITTGII